MLKLNAFTQAFCISIGQTAVFYGPGCFFYVVVEPDEFDLYAVFATDAAVVIDMQQDVSTPGVAVFGFAYGANIDGVTEVVLPVLAVVENAVVGLVGMAEAHDICVGVVHDAEHTFFFAVFKQVFVDLSGAAVYKQQVQLVIVELELDFEMGGQGAEVFSFFLFYDLVGEGDGYGSIGFLVVGLVRAAAIVAGLADTEVIITSNGGDTALPYFINYFIWPDVIAD